MSAALPPDQFRCDLCKGVFKKDWTDEEAKAEMLDKFGDVPEKERAVVCDDCFERMGLKP